MGKFKILFLPAQTEQLKQVFTDESIEKLKTLGDVVFNDKPNFDQFNEQDLIEAVKDIDIAITSWRSPCFTEKVMANANKLKAIFHSAGTVKPYVSPAVFEKNVYVTTANASMSRVTAEAALASIMLGNWEAKYWINKMSEGGWKVSETIVPGVQGQVIGIIGYGAITRALIPMLKVFNKVRIKIFSGHLSEEEAKSEGLEKATLEEILSTCDIISVQTSLTKNNYHMINDENLKLIKNNALLVNIGRGALIDEDALARHLSTGRFRAVLDVFTKEPLASDSPLRTLPNVICLPHLGAATKFCREEMGNEVILNIEDLIAGKEPRSAVSKETIFKMSDK